MKKLFSLLTLALLTMSAWAATDVTIDFSQQGYTNAQDFDGQTVTIGDVSVAFSKGTGTTTPKYYTSGTAMRIYVGNTMTVSTASTEPITKIVFTYASGTGNDWTSACVTDGAYDNGIWAGSATSILFTNVKDNQVRIISMVVTLGGEVVEVIDAPTLPAAQEFEDSFTVTITNNAADATVKYSTDSVTWLDYTAPFTITETTTVYAKAVKGDKESSVVSAKYTKLEVEEGSVIFLPTDFDAVTSSAFSKTKNHVTVAGTNGTINSTQIRMFKSSTTTISTTVGKIVKIEFTCTASGTAQYGPGCFAAQTGYSYEGTIGTWEGEATSVSFVAETNQVRATQIVVWVEGNDPAITVANPVFNPGSCTFTGSQQITLTCETEGAQILYAIDEGAYQNYTAPFTITQACTIKAKATLNGQESSEVTATYKKRTEVSTIAEANALDKKTDFVFYGPAVAVYQNGSNLWVKDNTGFGLIYGNQVPAIAEGATLAEGWEAQKTLYRGMIHEYQYPNYVEADPDEPIQTITATEYTRDALTTDNINERVIIKGLTLVEETDTEVENYARYLYNIVEGDTLVLYKFTEGVTYPAIEEGKTYDVEAMVSYFGNKVQLLPIAITEVVPEPDPELFILGEVNDNEWGAATGVPMHYDAETGLFNAEVTAEAENYDAELGGNYSFFSFTTKLADNDEDWNAIAGYRYGADAVGSFLVLDQYLGEELTLVQYGQIAFRVPSGFTYSITVNLETKKVIIDKVVTGYERGDVNVDGEIDINDVTRLIDVVLGKDVEYDPVAADCNVEGGDTSIDINDVTALINRVLTSNW